MKKHYILPVLLLLCISATAQINKGSILLGGQLSAQTLNQSSAGNEAKTNAWYLGVSAGKAFRDNQVFGATLGYGGGRRSTYFNGTDYVDPTTQQFGIGLFYRLYKPLGKGFYFFGEAAAGYNASTLKEHWKAAAADVKTTTQGFTLAVTPGLSYQVLKKLQLELTIPGLFNMSYYLQKEKNYVTNAPEGSQKGFSVSTNLANSTPLNALALGFRFVL